MPRNTEDLYIHSITYEAHNILRIELRHPFGKDLMEFTPGAHVRLTLNEKITRSYSLINDSEERYRYVIAVQKDNDGQGGSKWLHERARVGQKLQCSEPANAFPLNENANKTVLIAGGIGITPIWSMIQRLEKLSKPWELFYRARSRKSAPLMNELFAPERTGKINISFSNENSREVCDLTTVISNAPINAEFYCCGPLEMLQAFEQASSAVDPTRVHTEHFKSAGEAAVQGGFIVRVTKSKMELEVKEGQTILQVLRDAGLDPPYSCESGLCGECQTSVVSGVPDHQDLFLTKEEKEAGKSIMICCSGSLSPILEIDI